MKAFYITGSIIFTVLILILAFENLAVSCGSYLLVFLPMESGFFMTMAVSFVGVITGLFYAGLISQILKDPQEDEEAPGNQW